MLDFVNGVKEAFPPSSFPTALKIAVPGRWGEAPPLLWVGVGGTRRPWALSYYCRGGVQDPRTRLVVSA